MAGQNLEVFSEEMAFKLGLEGTERLQTEAGRAFGVEEKVVAVDIY